MSTPTKSITPTLTDEPSRNYPDWFKAAMLFAMSYREADPINGLLVYVLTLLQWAAHPTNIIIGPPAAVRPQPTWPFPIVPVGNAANAVVSAYDRELKKFDAHQTAVAEFTAVLLESIGAANRALILFY